MFSYLIFFLKSKILEKYVFSIYYLFISLYYGQCTYKNFCGVIIFLLSSMQYYLRTGGCKYGKACRYNHTKAKTLVTPSLELNFLGLPIRPVLLLFLYKAAEMDVFLSLLTMTYLPLFL